MLRTMMKSKIHRATVTQADLHYVGSVTVDEDLLDAADLLPGELVHIVDVTNGARLETYTIAGERGSGVIGINGAAARLVHPGDLVILIGYGQMDDRRGEGVHPTAWSSSTPTTGSSAPGGDPAGAVPGLGPGARRPAQSPVRRPGSVERPVLLCADIGNSHTALGLFDGGEVARPLAGEHRRAPHRRRVGGAAGGLLRESAVSEHCAGSPCAHGAGGAARVARDDGHHYLDVPHVVVEAGREDRRPAARWTTRARSAPTASSTRWPPPAVRRAPAIVVDFGTATTFDVGRPRGASTSAARSRPASRSPWRRWPPGRPAAQGRAAPAPLGDRQEHRRGPAVAACSSASPSRSTAWSPG